MRQVFKVVKFEVLYKLQWVSIENNGRIKNGLATGWSWYFIKRL